MIPDSRDPNFKQASQNIYLLHIFVFHSHAYNWNRFLSVIHLSNIFRNINKPFQFTGNILVFQFPSPSASSLYLRKLIAVLQVMSSHNLSSTLDTKTFNIYLVHVPPVIKDGLIIIYLVKKNPTTCPIFFG